MSRIIVKAGSNLLVKKDGQIDKRYIAELTRTLAGLIEKGHQVVLISSGAKAAGYGYLSGKYSSSDLYIKQTLCAAGQVQLMKLYETSLDLYGIKVAQVLLTREDFGSRKRFLNLRNTMIGITETGLLPIINENDTIATDEIMFGDNDSLASMFAIGWDADFLVLMTSVNGVLDEKGETIKIFDKSIKLKKISSTSWGSGGINTKIRAARGAAAVGVRTCICNGKHLKNISEFVETGIAGTVFPEKEHPNARKAWIGFLSIPNGEIVVNKGVAEALKHGKSILPVGIVDIMGNFNKGDVVEIKQDNGKNLGKGIVNFSHEELNKIKGKRSNQFHKILGYEGSRVAIHIDNLWRSDRS